MRIVISGGTGYIGRPLAGHLAGAGHAVTVLSRREGTSWHPGIELRQVASEAPIPPDVLSGMEAFLHLAAEPLAGRWTRARMTRIRESRTGGTERFMRQVASAPRLRVILNASGVGFYGDRPVGEVDEEAPEGQGFLAEVTAAREQMAERTRAPGRRVIHLRIGLVLHPSGGYLMQLAQMGRRGFNGQIGSGQQGVSWIHRGDLVRLVEHALAHPSLDGPVNACAPGRTTNRELARAVAAAAGRGGVRMPGWLARGMLGALGRTLLGGQHVHPARALESSFVFRHPALPGALVSLYGGADAAVSPALTGTTFDGGEGATS